MTKSVSSVTRATTLREIVATMSGFSPRTPGGSPGEEKTLAYLEEWLRKLGYEVRRESFAITGFEERDTRLRLLLPTGRQDISTYAFLRSCSTNGPLQAELVYVGGGRSTDYAPEAAKGRVLLMGTPVPSAGGVGGSGNEPHLITRIDIAQERGAVGVIMISGNPGNDIYSQGCDRMGSPLPAVGVGRADGFRLRQLLESGPVTVELMVDVKLKPGTSANVVATLPGRDLADEHIMLAAHWDGLHHTPAASDNASGCATMVEMARLLGEAASRPRRSISVLLPGAEEGGCTGSSEYVQAHRDEVRQIKALINVDIIGIGTQLTLVDRIVRSPFGHRPATPYKTSTWLNRAIEDEASRRGLEVGSSSWYVCSDEGPFIAVGIPGTWVYSSPDPTYQTPLDTPDRIDYNMMKTYTDLLAQTAWDLANRAASLPASVEG